MRTLRTQLLILTALACCAASFAQRTDERDAARGKKYLEEDPDYLKKLPKVVWRRPMGPYVKDVWPGYHGGPGPAKMVCRRTDNRLSVMGANFLLVWDDRRGGELSEIFLYDGGTWARVNCTLAYMGRDTIPQYAIQRRKDFHGDAPTYYLNHAIDTKIDVTRNTPEIVEFSTANRMVTMNRERGPWSVTQRFRVYPEGVVVCDFEIALDADGGPFALKHAEMSATLEDILFKEIYVDWPVHFRWGSADYGSAPTSEANYKTLSEDRMVPMGSATFGLSQRAGFTNRFEFWVERPRPLVGMPEKNASTQFRVFSSGLWYEPSDMSTRPNCGREYVWELYRGDPVEVAPPFAYRNRWVLAVGGAKVSASDETGYSRRCNLAGARIARWENDGYPGDAQIDALAKHEADVLVLANAWRRSDARLEAVVRKAHGLKMRVVVGVPFAEADRADALFKDLLTSGRDGLMIEGLGSAAMKPDVDLAAHVATLARLRALVGAGGILIGRATSGLPTQIELAFLDAATPADDAAAAIMRSSDRMLASDAAVGCALSPVIKADDRSVLAKISGVPACPQLVFADGVDDHPALGLWRMLSRFEGPVEHALSPTLENTSALTVEPKTMPTVAYLTKTQVLVIVANAGGKTKCRVTLDPSLGVGSDASGVQLTAVGNDVREAPALLRAGVVPMDEVGAGEVRGYLFSRIPPKVP